MAQTMWVVTALPTSPTTDGPQTETSAYDGRVRSQSYDLIVSGAENLSRVGATHSHLLPHAAPRLDTYDCFQLSHPSPPMPRHDEFSPPQHPTHLSYSLFPIGHEPMDDNPAASRNLEFSQSHELYNPWSSYHHSPTSDPPNVIVSSPALHQFSLDPALYPDSPCHLFPWPTESVQVGSVHEVPPTPTIYELPNFPLPDFSPSSLPNWDNASEPYSEALDASYPCQWTKGDVICNVMVRATRSHMNRHLHACHGFGGSDARQTRCYWAGCGATMQQGSIARHMVTCHLQAKVTCPMCFKKLSRQDVISKHQRVCPAASTWR